MKAESEKGPQELDPDEDKCLKEFLARPSTLPKFEADISGFQAEADALKVWEWVRGYLDVFGRDFNLERLHHLTIASDYSDALAKVERGIKSENVLTATRDEFAAGVAMAATILVDGIPKTHLLMSAEIVAPIADADHPAHALARYILAHECAHIHDLAEQDKAFPNVILRREIPQREAILQGIADACWSEYAACRLSARWAHDAETSLLEDTFCSSLEGLRLRGRSALLQYQEDRDVGKLLLYISEQYGRVMKYAAYLLGHLRGSRQEISEAAPRAAALVEKKIFFKPIFLELTKRLDAMWDAYGKWIGFEVYDPLKELAEEMLEVAGLALETMPDGQLYVHVSWGVTYWSTEDE
jgi:hypothetical protein